MPAAAARHDGALPAVTITRRQRTRPEHRARDGDVDNRNLDSTFHLRYGEGSVLNQRTADIQVNGGLKPNEVIEDLLDLSRAAATTCR